MKKGKLIGKTFGIALVFVLVGAMLPLGTFGSQGLVEASPTIIYVPDDHPTIQAAVNAASPGDTIVVRAGTYTENIDVNKDHLTIQSQSGANSTIVQAASPHDSVFDITAAYVNLNGFTATGAVAAIEKEEHVAGIYLGQSTEHCSIYNNVVCDNNAAAICVRGRNHTLRNNSMFRNIGNLGLDGNEHEPSDFTHDIDASNLVDGKPIYYWVNQHDKQIPSDAGFVALINCTNISVRDLTLMHNVAGVWLMSSSNSRIENVTASDNYIGIVLLCSSNNNIVSDNTWGGIAGSILLDDSSNNTIYINNFINNMERGRSIDSTNTWHSPEEITYTYNGNTYTGYLGNYWSDYTGNDADGDGIGETPYPIDSDADNYPLMEPLENYEIGPSTTWVVLMVADAGTEGMNADLEFGVQPDATDEYDSGIDLPSAPPQPGALFEAYFSIADPSFARLNKDFRGATPNGWTLKVKSTSHDIQLTWDASGIPSELCALMDTGTEQIDMKAQSSVVLSAGQYTIIVSVSEEVGIQLSLKAGWNMVSVPVIPADPSVGLVFAGTEVVYAWNAAARNYYMPAEVEPCRGYWVAVMSDTVITIRGVPVHCSSCEIKAGWNLIGSVMCSVDFSVPDTDPSGKVEHFSYRWNHNHYIYSTMIEPGMGHWIAATEDCVLKLCCGTCDLTVSSTIGGLVTTPGEGNFTYYQGTVVNLVATPASGYRFAGWAGDVDGIADVNDATTTIAMNDNYSITANFKAKSMPVNLEWTAYTSGAEITALVDDGDYLWVGSYGGLTRLNKTTGDMMHYDTANSGLPDNMISSIAKDVNGDLWIGTDNGLAKFDGTNWTSYNTDNSPLPENSIACLAIDADGNKWIGDFMGGLIKFDGIDWAIYNTRNSGLPVDDFREIVIDAKGNKWLGTNGGGLVKFDATNWTVYNTSNSGIPGVSISSIAFDANGDMWIGLCGWDYPNGLAKFDGTNWVVYNEGNSLLPSNCVRSIAIDAFGNKWIGTYKGFAKFDGVNWTLYSAAELLGFIAEDVYSVAIDADGIIWVGFYCGLARFDGTNWAVYNTGNSLLPDNYVTSIGIDDHGNKWIGTWYGGLAKFDGTNWTIYNTHNSPIPDNHAWFWAVDRDGAIWMSSYYTKCLVKFDGTDFTVYEYDLPDGPITSLAVDTNNNKWMLVYDYLTTSENIVTDWIVYLVKFDGTNVIIHNMTDLGLQFGRTSYLATDSDGNVWVGTQGFLLKFDGTNWITYNMSSSGLPSSAVYGLTVDTNGNVWVGTGGGLLKFDGTHWTVYDTTNSDLPSNYILGLAIGKDGNLWMRSWMGSAEALVKFDGTDWTVYDLMYGSGLPNRRINSFAIDEDGGVWIATWGGLGYSSGTA